MGRENLAADQSHGTWLPSCSSTLSSFSRKSLVKDRTLKAMTFYVNSLAAMLSGRFRISSTIHSSITNIWCKYLTHGTLKKKLLCYHSYHKCLGSSSLKHTLLRSTWQASLEHAKGQHGCCAAMKKTNRTVMDNGSGYLFHGESHTVLRSVRGR